MFRKTRRHRCAANAVLCIILVLNIHVWAGGCGQSGVLMPDGTIHIALTADHPVTQTLMGSKFEGATALEIDTVAESFRLVYPDSERTLSGQYSTAKRGFAITGVHFARSGKAADLTLNSSLHLTSVVGSNGLTWTRPDVWTGLSSDAVAQGVDAYMAANMELVEIAKQVDGVDVRPESTLTIPVGGFDDEGGSVIAQSKTDASAQDASSDEQAAAEMNEFLSLVVLAQGAGAAFPALYFVFQVLITVQLAMVIVGVAPSTTTGGDQTASVLPTGDATLRVTNNLTDGTPIWFVTFVKDTTTGAAGGNVLGDESIPAGGSRDFAVPAGVREINIIVPSGVECYVAYERTDVQLNDGAVTELTIEDTDVGRLFPEGCNNG